MALATTCPQCKTSFKVVPDQLKLRRGLVRCGVCQHVFSGIDYLRYVDDVARARLNSPQSSGEPGSAGSLAAQSRRDGEHGPAPPSTGGVLPGGRQARAPGVETGSPQTLIASEDELKTVFFMSDSTIGPYSRTRPQDVVPPRSIVAGGDEQTADERHQTGAEPDHRLDHDAQRKATGGRSTRSALPMRLDNGPWQASRHGIGDPDPLAPATDSRRPRSRGSVLAGPDREDPGLSAGNQVSRQPRDAYRTSGSSSGTRGSRGSRGSRLQPSRWQDDPEERGSHESFGTYFDDPRRLYAVIGLMALIVLQLTLLFRGEIASRLPALRPVVSTVAGIFGMSVDSVRSLSSLSIESFELQATGRDDHLALNAVLRNKDGHTVRWPAMELTLTDQSSAVVVRKVILPGDYLNRNASREGLSGRSEWPIRVNLDPGGLQLAGYSVALFYP